jgi:hypothetical protein
MVEATYSLDQVPELRGGIGLSAVLGMIRALRQIWRGTSSGQWVILTLSEPGRGAVRYKVDDELELEGTGSCSVIGDPRVGGAMAMIVDNEVIWPQSVPTQA